jgi:hypothetical protein
MLPSGGGMLKNWVLVVHDVCLKDIFIVQKAATTTLYVSLSMPSGYILACIEINRK